MREFQSRSGETIQLAMRRLDAEHATQFGEQGRNAVETYQTALAQAENAGAGHGHLFGRDVAVGAVVAWEVSTGSHRTTVQAIETLKGEGDGRPRYQLTTTAGSWTVQADERVPLGETVDISARDGDGVVIGDRVVPLEVAAGDRIQLPTRRDQVSHWGPGEWYLFSEEFVISVRGTVREGSYPIQDGLHLTDVTYLNAHGQEITVGGRDTSEVLPDELTVPPSELTGLAGLVRLDQTSQKPGQRSGADEPTSAGVSDEQKPAEPELPAETAVLLPEGATPVENVAGYHFTRGVLPETYVEGNETDEAFQQHMTRLRTIMEQNIEAGLGASQPSQTTDLPSAPDNVVTEQTVLEQREETPAADMPPTDDPYGTVPLFATEPVTSPSPTAQEPTSGDEEERASDPVPTAGEGQMTVEDVLPAQVSKPSTAPTPEPPEPAVETSLDRLSADTEDSTTTVRSSVVPTEAADIAVSQPDPVVYEPPAAPTEQLDLFGAGGSAALEATTAARAEPGRQNRPATEDVHPHELTVGERVRATGANPRGRDETKEGYVLSEPRRQRTDQRGERVTVWRVNIDARPDAEPGRGNLLSVRDGETVLRINAPEGPALDTGVRQSQGPSPEPVPAPPETAKAPPDADVLMQRAVHSVTGAHLAQLVAALNSSAEGATGDAELSEWVVRQASDPLNWSLGAATTASSHAEGMVVVNLDTDAETTTSWARVATWVDHALTPELRHAILAADNRLEGIEAHRRLNPAMENAGAPSYDQLAKADQRYAGLVPRPSPLPEHPGYSYLAVGDAMTVFHHQQPVRRISRNLGSWGVPHFRQDASTTWTKMQTPEEAAELIVQFHADHQERQAEDTPGTPLEDGAMVIPASEDALFEVGSPASTTPPTAAEPIAETPDSPSPEEQPMPTPAAAALRAASSSSEGTIGEVSREETQNDFPLWDGGPPDGGEARGTDQSIQDAFAPVMEAWDELVPAAELGTSAEMLSALEDVLQELAQPWNEAAFLPGSNPLITSSRDTRAELGAPHQTSTQHAAAVNGALAAADEQQEALGAQPEWQEIQSVRQATRNLWTALKHRAGEYFDELRSDGRVQNFLRAVSIRVCEKLATLATTAAERLRQGGEGSEPAVAALSEVGGAARRYSERSASPSPRGEGGGRVDVPDLQRLGAALQRPMPVSAAAARSRSGSRKKVKASPGRVAPRAASPDRPEVQQRKPRTP